MMAEKDKKVCILIWIAILMLVSLACGSFQISIVTSASTNSDLSTASATHSSMNAAQPPKPETSTPDTYPAPVVQITRIPEKAEAYPEPEITSTPTSIPTMPVLPGVDIPASLYFRIGRATWRLDPGEYQARMVTPIDTTAFDVWPQDGRMAFANQDGELYVVMPDKEVRLVYQAGGWIDCGLRINNLAWSPDGSKLAYSITIRCPDYYFNGYEDPELMAQPTGVWVLSLTDGSNTQLLRNRYLDKNPTDVNRLRIIMDIDWSPDGEALLLHTSHWEWDDVYWLYPLVFTEDEANLHDPEEMGWMNAAWGQDGKTVLLSGMSYSGWSDLIRVNRNTMMEEVLVASGFPDQGVYVSQAQELVDGIAFFMSPTDNNGDLSSHLYLGNENAEGFSYVRVGPDRDFCKFAPSNIAWDASESLVVLACGENIVQLISMDGSIDIDLAPYLSTLLAEVDYPYNLEIFWGAANK